MDETSSPNKKRLIGELVRGRDSTKELQNLLRRKVSADGSVSVDDLVIKILGSFSDSLSVLGSCVSGEVFPAPANTYAGSDCSGDRTWDTGESEMNPAPAVKDRRGCYKRRKTADSRIKIVDTIEDGYAWRKYGQKKILDAKFPRCYFRCTHKSEGCKALKQVQKLEDGSEMYHITYFGHHTCQNTHTNTHMFSDSGALNFFLINYEDSKMHHSSTSPSTITNAHIGPSLDQEDGSYAQSDHLSSSDHGQSSFALWKDMFGVLETPHEDIFKNGDCLGGFKFDENIFS